MKLAISLLFVGALAAQTPPGVLLTWTDTANLPGTTYSVYRAPGLCSGTPVFAKIATGVTAKTYDDLSAVNGNFAYVVTATQPGGLESAQSACTTAAVLSRTPQGLNSAGH